MVIALVSAAPPVVEADVVDDGDVACCDVVSSVTAAEGLADMLIAFIERIVGVLFLARIFLFFCH